MDKKMGELVKAMRLQVRSNVRAEAAFDAVLTHVTHLLNDAATDSKEMAEEIADLRAQLAEEKSHRRALAQESLTQRDLRYRAEDGEHTSEFDVP